MAGQVATPPGPMQHEQDRAVSEEPSASTPLLGNDTARTGTTVYSGVTRHAVPGTNDSVYSVFTPAQRRGIIMLCAAAGFFSPFSAYTYFPAIKYIADDLGVSLELMNITITVFLLVQGVMPTILGDMADQIGRRPSYLFALTIYFFACFGLSIQRTYPALLILRMFQSAGSSGTIALGIMTVADIAPPHARGRYVGAMLTGPNSGPSIGPVIGGILAEKAGWPWTFWMLVMTGGACLVLFALLFPETCRNVVGNGSAVTGLVTTPILPPLKPGKDFLDPGKHANSRFKSVPNPLKCLRIVFQKEDALILASNSVFYASYSCMQAALAPLLMDHYGLNALDAGLCFMTYGLACLMSSYAVGKVLDYDYTATAKAAGIKINRTTGDDLGSFPIEKARLRSVWAFIVVGIMGTIAFGWAIEMKLHLSIPLICAFCCGVAFTGVFNTNMTLNVDLHPNETGLASVAVSLTRAITASVAVVFLQLLLNGTGAGWTFTIISALSSLSIPMLIMVRVWGHTWRSQLPKNVPE